MPARRGDAGRLWITFTPAIEHACLQRMASSYKLPLKSKPKPNSAWKGQQYEVHVPAVRIPSAMDVLDWVAMQRERGLPVKIVGLDEQGDTSVTDCNLTVQVVIVAGNKTVAGRALARGLRRDRADTDRRGGQLA